MNTPFFINMPIPAEQFAAVCALLGAGAASAAPALAAAPSGNAATTDAAPSAAASPSASVAEASPPVATDDSANAPAGSDGEIDAHGHPWSADLHASTKGKTKDGLWRMKVGVSRPDPLPGFPAASSATGADTGTSPTADTSPSATSPDATGAATGQPDTSTDDEDEFAAFRTAAAASETVDANAAASVPARSWTDADLGALCNQGAVKLGDPSPIKDLIAQYVPAGEVAHSRNIPADKREEFAKAVEAKAGIEFTG